MTNELAAQYAALRESWGLWPNVARALVAVTDDDRVRLVDGLVTCELKTLQPGQGVHGLFTDVKGHVLADVVVLATADALWLDLPVAAAPAIAAHIEKYVVVDRVEVSSLNDYRASTVLGPQGRVLLAEALGEQAIADGPWGHRAVDLDGEEGRLFDDRRFGVAASTLWSTRRSAEVLRQRLQEAAGEGALPEIGDAAVEVVRVEESRPRFGVDFGPDNLPQETGLEEDVVSYTKGCYLGQEVVARLHYRGQAARRLSTLRWTATEAPDPGSELSLGGRVVGVVTSVARSPVSDELTALAMLQRRALAPGTEVRLASGDVARVV